MTVVVVSQPMFLPWIGLFEQMAMADVFVHYDDVQLPQGRSFITRVQVKTRDGVRWLSVPVDHRASGPRICDTHICDAMTWRKAHLETLRHSYSRAPGFPDMFALAQDVLLQPHSNLADFNIHGMERIAAALGLKCRFLRASELGIGDRGSDRLLAICAALDASAYVTGHGARNYLDHRRFEERGIAVRYMDYAAKPWPQLHGPFTPFVTILDLMGALPFSDVRNHFKSSAVDWKAFLEKEMVTA